jgi:hypothetical protein
MLAKSCSGLWIVKAEPKCLETFLGVVKSLGMSVTLIWSNIVASYQMTDMCVAKWNWGSKSKPFVCHK